MSRYVTCTDVPTCSPHLLPLLLTYITKKTYSTKDAFVRTFMQSQVIRRSLAAFIFDVMI